MLVTFQKKLHETTGRIICIRVTLHFRFIFLCSIRMIDLSHSSMEADCAYKFSGRPLCGITECETSLFHQQACKTPFYKHYLHCKFLKLFELLMFLEFWWRFNILRLYHDFLFGHLKRRNTITYFVCILSKTFSTINHTFFLFYVLKNHIFNGSCDNVHWTLLVVTFATVSLDSLIWVKVGHQCKNKSEPKLWCATITPYITHRIIVELSRKLLL